MNKIEVHEAFETGIQALEKEHKVKLRRLKIKFGNSNFLDLTDTLTLDSYTVNLGSITEFRIAKMICHFACFKIYGFYRPCSENWENLMGTLGFETKEYVKKFRDELIEFITRNK